MSHVNDMKSLRLIEQSLPAGNTLRKVLEEVREINKGVLVATLQPTSGTAISRYDPADGHKRKGWELKYQDGNLGNLVHELTHAVTHKQYETDGITYRSDKTVVARTYTKGFPFNGHTLAYCDNEELRQMQFRIDAAESWMTTNTNRLYRWAKQYGLSAERLAKCKERREYGLSNIQREYDTLINQMLVWLYEWGYYPLAAQPNPPPPSFAFYLEAAVLEAYNRRRTKQAIGGQANIVPEPPIQLITITLDQWKKDTSLFAKTRSTELKQVDAALAAYHASNNIASRFKAAEDLRKAFDNWKRLHPNTKRNSKNNIVALLDAQISAATPF